MTEDTVVVEVVVGMAVVLLREGGGHEAEEDAPQEEMRDAVAVTDHTALAPQTKE